MRFIKGFVDFVAGYWAFQVVCGLIAFAAWALYQLIFAGLLCLADIMGWLAVTLA